MSERFGYKEDSAEFGGACVYALRRFLEESFTKQQALDLVTAMVQFRNHEQPIMMRYGLTKDGDGAG